MTCRARAEGREPIRGRECGNGMQTNREPSGRLQGGKKKTLSRAHRRASCSC
jgi:hypothetical protein